MIAFAFSSSYIKCDKKEATTTIDGVLLQQVRPEDGYTCDKCNYGLFYYICRKIWSYHLFLKLKFSIMLRNIDIKWQATTTSQQFILALLSAWRTSPEETKWSMCPGEATNILILESLTLFYLVKMVHR